MTFPWVNQRQKNPVGVSALPTGKFLRVRKVFARIYTIDPKIKSKDCIGLESFQTLWKVSGQSGKFPDSWKVSRQSGKFPDSLENFRTVWKVSGQSGKFPDSVESFWTVWKVSGQSGKFPDSLESFRTVWKISREYGKFPDSLKTSLFYVQELCKNLSRVKSNLRSISVCCENKLRTFETNVAKKTYALRPESLCA